MSSAPRGSSMLVLVLLAGCGGRARPVDRAPPDDPGGAGGGSDDSGGSGGASTPQPRDAASEDRARDGGARVDAPRSHDTASNSDARAPAPLLDGPLPPPLPDPDPAIRPVFAQDFELLPKGSRWLKSCKWNKHVAVTDACGVGGSKCLRVAQDPDTREPPLFPLPPEDERPPYPPGSTGVCYPYYTNTGTDVVQAVQPLPPALEYSLSYDLFFEPGYDWARAGKLPGLSAKEWDSGCSIEGDGLKTDPGPARWSVRVMWRAVGTNELYVYDQDRIPGACGARRPTPIVFGTGKWISVTVHVKLNSTAALHDGSARVYFDGVLAREETNLRLRAVEGDASLISNIFFSTFFGGNESKRLWCMTHPDDPMYCAVKDPMIETTWVPKTLSYVDFDNIAVYPGLRVRTRPGQ